MQDQLVPLLPAIRRFAYSLTGAPADADDLLQMTVERLLTRSVPDDVELLKWAFRVCRNLWIDEYRARQVRQRATENPALRASVVDGEAAIHNHISVGEVNAAMQELPDEQRTILALVAVEGLAYKDVAQALQVPLGTVMSRLARARAALADRFRDSAGVKV